MRREVAIVPLTLLLVLGALTSCGTRAAVGCIGAARYAGHVYKPLGFTSNATTRLRRGTYLATCAAVRERGFARAAATAPTRSKVWSVRGYDPTQVIAVKVNSRAWQVLIVEPAPHGLVERMSRLHVFNAGTD